MANFFFRGCTVVAALGMLAACGGGGGGGGGPGPIGGVSGYTPGVYQPSSTYAAQCASPRTGASPITGQPYPDRPGSTLIENLFLRSWTNDLYLWYGEVPDLDPSGFSPASYFDVLKTSASTASGQPKDKFHFPFPTADWEALSRAGEEIGYGAAWLILADTPPRQVLVAYVEPDQPASAVSLTRGLEVIRADGVDVINSTTAAAVDTLNAAFFPARAGESHTFTVRELSGAERTVTMASVSVTHTPVLIVSTIPTQSGPVGYILFNDHIAPAESALINAVNTLNARNVVDLILDIRYNGGGFLDIASELAYMIGGGMTVGRTFERLVFNEKHTTTNPVTNRPLAPLPFHTTTQGFSTTIPSGTALPTLNLPIPRVYVLTGPGTCSASESVINSLRGVDVEVYQIGSTTCGKPYGFYPQDNCGTTYFSIQFQGLNAKNFGEYSDGFSPHNTGGTAGERIPGCSVADDLTRALGEPNEGRLAAALAFRSSSNQTCPVASGFGPGMLTKPGQALSAADGVMNRSPLRENRILTGD